MMPTSSQYVNVNNPENALSISQSSGKEPPQILTPVEVINIDAPLQLLSNNENSVRLVTNTGQYFTLDENNPNTYYQIITPQSNYGAISTVYNNRNSVRNANTVNSNQYLMAANYPQTPTQPPAPKRRGRRPGRKNKTRDEDDPDYVPDIPEELLNLKTTISTPSDQMSEVNSVQNFDQDFDYASEAESLTSYIENDFTCEICSRSFHGQAGLSRHKMLMHSGKKVSVGPKVDPARRAEIRYNNLKSALEKASPDDIIMLAAPYVAKHVSLWKYLFYRSEFANKSPEEEVNVARLPIPPPDMPTVVAEYLGFVGEFRENFPRVAKRIRAIKRPHPASEGGDANNANSEIENDAKLIESFGPGPLSVKMQRYRAFRKDLESRLGTANNQQAELADDVNTNCGDGTELGVIEVKDSLQSCVLGVTMGCYKARRSFPPDLLPSRFENNLAEEVVDLGDSHAQKRQSSEVQQSKSKIIAVDDLDEEVKSAPKKACIVAGVQPETVDMVETVIPEPTPEILDSRPCTSTATTSTGLQANVNVGDGSPFSGPIPDELIRNGTFIPLTVSDGSIDSEYVYHHLNGYVYNRRTGALATEDEVQIYQNPSAGEILLEPLSETMSKVILPDGTMFHVQHGPEGLTPEMYPTLFSQMKFEDGTQLQMQ